MQTALSLPTCTFSFGLFFCLLWLGIHNGSIFFIQIQLNVKSVQPFCFFFQLMRDVLRNGRSLPVLLRRGNGFRGHRRHPALRRKPGAGELADRSGILRDPRGRVGRSRDHGPEDARHAGNGHGFVHAVDGHVLRPCVFERKHVHDEIGSLGLFEGGQSIALDVPPNTHCRKRSAGWVSYGTL